MFKTSDFADHANIHIKKYNLTVGVFSLVLICNRKVGTSILHWNGLEILFSSTIDTIIVDLCDLYIFTKHI